MTSERPQTHSIKDIYNVGTRFLLRRSADELAWIPGISHTRNLVNNGVNTVGELFDGDLNQTKNLKDLKRGLESHTDLIYDIFHSDGFDMETGLKTVTLPINYDAGRPFIDNARAFIKDLHDTVVSEGDNSSISKTSFAYTIKEIYVYNPNHPECASYADIARKFNCTSFNINYKLLTMRKHLRSLFKGETVEIEDVCFRADPRMISDLERFADMVGNTISVESFKRKSGASDGRTLSFLTDILGMNTTAGVSGKKIPCVSKHPQKLIDTSIGTLLEFFRSNVIHIRYDHEFRIFLEKTFGDTPDLVDAFNSLVKHSDEFVWSNEDGEEVVALRWDLLEFIPARICRILFDNNCPVTSFINPQHVGLDIGCGIDLEIFDRPLDRKDYALFEHRLRMEIPSGFNINRERQFEMKPFLKYLRQELSSARQSSGGLVNHLELTGERELEDWIRSVGMDKGVFYKSVGSIGGGNHFMEYDEGDGRFAFTVHTGSRHLGLKVFNKWDRIAQRNPNAPGYLVDENLKGYLTDMVIAQAYARFNREVVLGKAAKIMHKINGARVEGYIRTTHNYVDFRDMILRKGAIRSYAGELMVIPFNMRDGIVVCEGRSNPEWNFSAPHGSGRCMSRANAKRNISMVEYHRQMEGIYTTSVTPETLDEAPGAYKDTDSILESLGQTCAVQYRMLPKINIKNAE